MVVFEAATLLILWFSFQRFPLPLRRLKQTIISNIFSSMINKKFIRLFLEIVLIHTAKFLRFDNIQFQF